MSYIDRYEELAKREQELRQNVADVDAMIDAIDGGRDRLEVSLGSMNMSIAEMKGQIRITKERQVWIISEIDKLRAQIAKDDLQ